MNLKRRRQNNQVLPLLKSELHTLLCMAEIKQQGKGLHGQTGREHQVRVSTRPTPGARHVTKTSPSFAAVHAPVNKRTLRENNCKTPHPHFLLD